VNINQTNDLGIEHQPWAFKQQQWGLNGQALGILAGTKHHNHPPEKKREEIRKKNANAEGGK